MSTDTPEPRTEVKPEWAPLPPAAPRATFTVLEQARCSRRGQTTHVRQRE